MQKKDTGAYFGNTIHTGSLPKNTKVGNSNENAEIKTISIKRKRTEKYN